MSTTKLVLLGLVLSSTGVSSESHLAKCCPPGEIFSGYSTVECVSKPRNVIELYVHQWNTTVKHQGIPQCDEPEDLVTTSFGDLDSNNFLEVPACLEILHDQVNGESTVIVVHCRSNKDRRVKAINASFPQLAYVRKCCPRDTIFDSRTKACVSRLSESESLVAFLRNGSDDADLVTIATEGPPTCKGPIVDYEIDENDVFLRNGTYTVMVPTFKNSFVKEELSVTEDNACLDMTPDSESDRTLVARVCRDPEFCDGNACIRKCCAENEFFYAQGCNKLAVPGEPTEFHVALANAVSQTKSSAFDTTRDYGVLIGKPCKYGMYPTDPREEEWLLTSEGHVFVEDYAFYDQNNYCMDIFYNKSEFDHNFHLFICFDSPALKEVSVRFRMNTALQITSCAFLLMTLLVYVCLPSLQNLHGKTLMCHVSSLLLAFTCLPIITWITPGDETEERSTTTCKALAYTALFSFLSAFSWLNVMCFDIWWTFGVLRGSTFTKAAEHRKRFLLYCLYAWGLSFLVSILAIVADSTDILPDYLQPNIGNSGCWFTQRRNSYGELTFFIGPVTIMLISNVIFFILTSTHCNKVKAEIKRVTTDPMDPRNKRFRSDRRRFVMNVKLFIVMGMSWICEVVSFFLIKYVDYEQWHHVFFYTSDVFNCLQGLLIFILFVLKSRVYQALRRRLGLNANPKKPTCNATTTLHDPYRVRKSASSSTLTTTFAINSTP
ncbi:G-protein coupled receptor Mth2-like [Temnothorax curvispinosus]|uniref:G-protein coupled receptor Mth2-like n=1 Tax=Temnothorax curvispinosus TaxID=300111 RepID=A0A6J1QXZ0_9HYME|nr:G-protein coupled receptor Mth2-like [Temnothorax curvispinosus]XP_024885511.1 G-protein coupled receptor Mth2-like [Temnothorax curvispinosus]